jgi:hypothetical protein
MVDILRILWHIDLLLGNDHGISKNITKKNCKELGCPGSQFQILGGYNLNFSELRLLRHVTGENMTFC